MKKLFSKMDIWLLVLMIFYSIFGLLMIYSSSSVSAVLRYDVPQYYFFLRQAIFIVIAFAIGFLLVLRTDTKAYKFLSYIAMIIVFGALVFVLIRGSVTNNAQSWIKIGPISIQPSEFAKSSIIVYLACAYYSLEKKQKNSISSILFPIAICIIPVFLIIKQPDFGTALIICGIIFFIFMSIPIVKKNIIKVLKYGVIAVVVIICALFFSGTNILNSGQLSRLNFKAPCTRYIESSGYQVCNGFIAIHNGGLFGVGLGNSSQKYLYLPESHTDFIFPIIVEEWGAIVGILLIIGYIIMLYRILKIAREGENLKLSILAYGTFIYLLLHILINLLGVLALIPLTGVPLPLLSYGGSFNLNVILMLFVVQRVNIENKTLKNKRELAGVIK